MGMSRRIVAFAAVFFALTLVGDAAWAKVSKGDRAVELSTVKTRKNRKLRLSAYRGKVVVLTFGASWCKPCRKELPAYEKLARRYKKAAKPVVFIAVNIDSERANGEKFVKQAGLSAVVVGFDTGGGTVDKYEPGTMPSTYIIDAKGIVREVHAGYDSGDEKTVAHLVDGLL